MIKPSEIILVTVAVGTAVGAVLFSLLFLLIMARGPAFLASSPPAVSIPNKQVRIVKITQEVANAAVIPSPTQIPSPTKTRTPTPTLYSHQAMTREFQSFPVVIQPTEISAASLPPTEGPEPKLVDITHLVRPDENLYRIAQKYDVSVEAIKDLNDLFNPRVINPGRTLMIPMQELGFPPSASIATLTFTSEASDQGDVSASSLDETAPTQPPQIAALELAPETVALDAAASVPDISPSPSPEPVTPAAATSEPAAPTATREQAAPTPDPIAPVYAINGLPLDSITVMAPDVLQHIRAIYDRGQALGNNTHAFSKVGDSTSAYPYFLAHFDGNSFNLGPYSYLQPVINYFSGSFARRSVANRVGLHSWTVTDPAMASNTICLSNESPIACEIRLHRPIIILIRLGSNDRGASGLFDSSMRQVVQIALDNGVIPVLGTKPDRFEGSSDVNNTMIRQIAADYRIPLWELDQASATIPGRGLASDDVHLTSLYPYDYGLSWAMQRGHAIQNISALMTLRAILEELNLLRG